MVVLLCNHVRTLCNDTLWGVVSFRPPVFVGRGPWCQRGHPVRGARLPLRTPPEAMEQGLYGELSLLPITILTPCVQQYPNIVTRLTQIQVSLTRLSINTHTHVISLTKLYHSPVLINVMHRFSGCVLHTWSHLTVMSTPLNSLVGVVVQP